MLDTNSRRLPLLLGFLTAAGPLSTDMYLPAFPAIEAEFGTGPGSAQITFASWFAGLAVGQITQGTLSDRLGRRGPLMLGLAIYTAASIGCAVAPSLAVLTVLRAVAAFGASASMVLPRAVVRDLADGLTAARLLSQLMLVMGAAPILAPALGGAMLGFSSWRSIFWFASAHGALSMLLVWRALPETLPERRRLRLGVAGLLSRYGTILRDRGFTLHVAIGAFILFTLFAYLSGAPPLYIDRYGLSAPQCGALVGLCSGGFIAGSQANPRLVTRFGLSAMLRMAVRIAALASLAGVVLAWTGPFGIWSVAGPIMVAATVMGTVMPNATVGALSRQGANAGSASAVMGTIQYMLAALSGSLVGLLTDGTPRPMAALMLVGTALAMVADWLRTAWVRTGR